MDANAEAWQRMFERIGKVLRAVKDAVVEVAGIIQRTFNTIFGADISKTEAAVGAVVAWKLFGNKLGTAFAEGLLGAVGISKLGKGGLFGLLLASLGFIKEDTARDEIRRILSEEYGLSDKQINEFMALPTEQRLKRIDELQQGIRPESGEHTAAQAQQQAAEKQEHAAEIQLEAANEAKRRFELHERKTGAFGFVPREGETLFKALRGEADL
jgi:hypothetical protein